MARLLLRILLILSLVTNGVAAPWAMAAAPQDAHAGHAAGHSEGAAPMAAHGGHHEGGAARATMPSHHGHDPGAPAEAAPDGSCCDGAGCDCGCVLPPMLARPASPSLASAGSLPPVAEPPLRARLANTAPPFRPPAA